MFGIAGLVLISAIGVDYGWKQTEDGKLEYIIQIKPEQLQSLAEGDDIASFIHPDAKRVTCFRVRVGDGDVPRETILTPSGPIEASPTSGIDDGYGSHRPALRNQPRYSAVSDQQGQFGAASYGTTGQYGPMAPHYGPTTQQYGAGQDYQQQNHGQAYGTGPYSPQAFSRLDPDYYGQNNYTSHNNYGNAYGSPVASLPRTAATQTYRAGTTNTPGIGMNNNSLNRQMQPVEPVWWPLFFTSTLLFLSLGGNAYLGWVAAEFYTRYRDTVERMRAERRY